MEVEACCVEVGVNQTACASQNDPLIGLGLLTWMSVLVQKHLLAALRVLCP